MNYGRKSFIRFCLDHPRISRIHGTLSNKAFIAENGATTLSLMTTRKMTLIVTTLSTLIFRITTHSIMVTLSIMIISLKALCMTISNTATFG